MAANPLLLKGFTSGWLQKFFNEPFDPLCIMLAMRSKLLLDAIDELGHSYNLLRSIGYGWIDFGEIPGELPGNPEDYYPPGIDEPIIITPPGPGEPGYVPPGPGEPGYTPPGPGEPGFVPPGPGPGEPGFVPPGPGEPGYVPPGGVGRAPGYGGGALGADGGSMAPPWGLGYGPGETGGHVGGAGGGGGLDCCMDKDNPSIYVHIEPATASINCGDTLILSVAGHNPLCEDENYEWLLYSTQGSISAVVGFSTTYTTPAAGADCETPVDIGLFCNGVLVDSISIVLNPCPASASIGYDYNYMSVNETKELTAVPGAQGCGTPAYTWEITAGGGSLSSSSGASTIYTAPASNVNCLQNPTITLSCPGMSPATLEIAVNAVPGTLEFATIKATGDCANGGVCTGGPCPPQEEMGCCTWSVAWYCGVWRERWYCDGAYWVHGSADFCINYSPPLLDGCATHGSGCINCGTYNGIVAACSGTTDVRSPAMKTAGCCPPQAL